MTSNAALNLPENGYTPANYQALVDITELENPDFCNAFGVNESTFYKHKSGDRTMKWKEWQKLQATVIDYLILEQCDMKAYKFESHSKATKFMNNYYINMCGYKLFSPLIENGVFAVASKENDEILTLLDDKTIRKSTGRKCDNGVLTDSEYKTIHDEYADIAGAASQDE